MELGIISWVKIRLFTLDMRFFTLDLRPYFQGNNQVFYLRFEAFYSRSEVFTVEIRPNIQGKNQIFYPRFEAMLYFGNIAQSIQTITRSQKKNYRGIELSPPLDQVSLLSLISIPPTYMQFSSYTSNETVGRGTRPPHHFQSVFALFIYFRKS